MTKRAIIRPTGFVKPAYWDDSPAPAPQAIDGDSDKDGPTRYGDWVKNGIAVDF